MADYLLISPELNRIICRYCKDPTVLQPDRKIVVSHMLRHGLSGMNDAIQEKIAQTANATPWYDVQEILRLRQVPVAISHLHVKNGCMCPVPGCNRIFAGKAWYKHKSTHNDVTLVPISCKYQVIGKDNIRIGVQQVEQECPIVEQEQAAVEESSKSRLLRELALDGEPSAATASVTQQQITDTQTCAIAMMDTVWRRRRDVFFKVMLEYSTSSSMVRIPMFCLTSLLLLVCQCACVCLSKQRCSKQTLQNITWSRVKSEYVAISNVQGPKRSKALSVTETTFEKRKGEARSVVEFLLKTGNIAPTSSATTLSRQIVDVLQVCGTYSNGSLQHFFKDYLRLRCRSVSTLRHVCAELRFFFQICCIFEDIPEATLRACLEVCPAAPNIAFIIAITASSAAQIESDTDATAPILTYHYRGDTFIVNQSQVSVSDVRATISKWRQKATDLCKSLTGGTFVKASNFHQPSQSHGFLFSEPKTPVPLLKHILCKQLQFMHGDQWSKPALKRWQQEYSELMQVLLSLIIVTSGGPPRATEIQGAQIAGARSFHLSGSNVCIHAYLLLINYIILVLCH